jgi:CRP/FNR family transcriptional regulator
MDKLQILQQFSFFRDAPPALREEVLASGTVVELPPKAYIFREGDEVRQFALVGAGRIRVFKSAESGREITLYHVGPGECCLLNISCLTSGNRIPATAQAETTLSAFLVPGETFRDFLGRSPEFRTYVFGLLAHQLSMVMALVEEVAFKRMDRRLAEYLLAERAKAPGSEGAVHATHEQIAVELGSAREVVSRLLKEFERMGAVELHRGRVEFANAALLRGVAKGD